jgi:hypothetical protein
MASCPAETKQYRQCLKDARVSGRKNACTYLAETLEACREKWRNENQIRHQFDGTRVLPNSKCQPLNAQMQHCFQWKKGDQSICQESIQALQDCMKSEKGVVVAPAGSDTIWSDYKGPKPKK